MVFFLLRWKHILHQKNYLLGSHLLLEYYSRELNENRLILEQQLARSSTNPLSIKSDYTESAPVLF